MQWPLLPARRRRERRQRLLGADGKAYSSGSSSRGSACNEMSAGGRVV